jgi:hypothetical protein
MVTDGTVLHLTYASSPRDREWECRIPNCPEKVYDRIAPQCPRHDIRMVDRAAR